MMKQEIKTVVVVGMSNSVQEVCKQNRINSEVQFVFDVGPAYKRLVGHDNFLVTERSFDLNPFNGIVQEMVDDHLAMRNQVGVVPVGSFRK